MQRWNGVQVRRLKLPTTESNWLLDIALDNLSLGRALAGLTSEVSQDLSDVLTYLNRAVDGLRQAGHQA